MNRTSQRTQPTSLVEQLKRSLLIVVSLLVCVLILSFPVGIYNSNIQHNLDEQKAALQEGQNNILLTMVNQETGLRGYISTDNTVFLEPFTSGRTQYLLAVRQMKDQALGSALSETTTALAQVEERANAWYSTYAQVQLKNMQSGKLATARSDSNGTVGKALFDQFRASVAHLQAAIGQDLNTLRSRLDIISRLSLIIARQLVLRAEVEQGIDFLESNPLKLRQVLLNLVSNALKFTEQGEVTVSARRVMSSDSEADRIALAVQDSGVGIPTDLQERVFEAFYQADGSYTRKVGGTGLGLSIVSQLTTLLGGRIELESAPGQGSTFTVILPIKAVQQPVGQETPRLHTGQQEDVPARAPSSDECMPGIPREVFPVPAQREATDGQTNVVLAVDDNPDVIALITASLRDTPYRVVGALDPLQVMQMVQELHPCAITLDVKMPDVNGWQILHQLKANAATASIPVVMITVLSEPTTGYVLGADAYVIKPFKTDVVLSTLQHLIAAQNTLSSQQG